MGLTFGTVERRVLELTAPAGVTARFRAAGWWRSETFLDDLYRTAAAAPERPAIVSERALRRPAGAGSLSRMPNSPCTSIGSRAR